MPHQKASLNMRLRLVSFSFLAAALLPVSASADQNRFRLAAAERWGAKKGFYLNFENVSPKGQPCALESLRLILGVADGKRWRFISTTPAWETDRVYHVKAVLADGHAEVWLDGQRVANSPGGFAPAARPIAAAQTPPWANGHAEYLILQSALRVAAGDVVREAAFPADRVLPMGLLLFQPQAACQVEWDAATPRPWVMEAQFRVLMRPPLRSLAPFVDRYGQCRYGQWPGKVRNDDELRADIAAEEARLAEMPPSPDFDRYGGWKRAGWSERGTGFFRVVRREGFWWLVTPEGNPCFYTGVDTAPQSTWPQTPVAGREFIFEWLPPKQGAWRASWGRNHWGHKDGDYVCLQACNLIRKYGPDAWQERVTAQAAKRLRCWRFGGGKWGAPAGVVSTPVLYLRGVPKAGRHPDVFDPKVCERIRASLAKQIEPRKSDPLVLGWSIGNEFNEIITPDDVRKMLQKPASTPGKRALAAFALASVYHGDLAALVKAWRVDAKDWDALLAASPKPPDADVERLRRVYADRYYQTLYAAAKAADPNHLYLGCWIVPGWWVNEEDWRLVARHCDVIGYDRYALEFADERLLRLMKETDKPALWGEFCVPPTYGGRRGFGQYGTYVQTEQETAASYEHLIRQAAANPYCVGAMWFEYRDQAITGRGPGHGERLVFGEHYAFGLVTITDRVKWPLVHKMREVNLAAPGWRH